MGRLVEQMDVHGAVAGPRLPVLVVADGHLDLDLDRKKRMKIGKRATQLIILHRCVQPLLLVVLY